MKKAGRLASAFKTFCDERLNLIFIDTSAHEQLHERRMMKGEDNASRGYDVYTAIELPVSQQPGLMALSGISRLSRVSAAKTEWAIGFERTHGMPGTFWVPFSEPAQLQHYFPLLMKTQSNMLRNQTSIL